MLYYVMKSGLPMFDTCRAYGLAFIIEWLAREADAIEDVTICDVGPLYLLEGPEIEELLVMDAAEVFEPLVVPTDGWCGVLLTTGRSPSEERVKPDSRKKLEAKIAGVTHCLLDYEALLHHFTEPQAVELRPSQPEKEKQNWPSVPGSLDVGASKGIRRVKRRGYGEGKQLFVNLKEWAIALLGGAHFIRWTWVGGDYCGLLAMPRRVTMRDNYHYTVKKIADRGNLCGVSTATAAAHYGVQLANALRERRADLSAYADSYSALVTQTMTYSGSQWKAQNGGVFPLQYPLALVESDLSLSANIFDVWNRLFRWGSVRGKESLALRLADFLSEPTLTTFERYAQVHLRMTLIDKKRRSRPPYQTEWLEEVLRYVK